jgi:hypothetical protein
MTYFRSKENGSFGPEAEMIIVNEQIVILL